MVHLSDETFLFPLTRTIQRKGHKDAVGIRLIVRKWLAFNKSVPAVKLLSGKEVIPRSGFQAQARHTFIPRCFHNMA